MMPRPLVLAVVDEFHESADHLLGYWIIPTSVGVGSDFREYIPGLSTYPPDAVILTTTAIWLASLEKVSDEPSNIYLLFGSIKPNEFVIYMTRNDHDGNDATNRRIHQFAIFTPSSYSPAGMKLRKVHR
jgi:hypothetical protein